MLCFKNGVEQVTIALSDRAFHYGDGCFSTARLREGQLELHDLHWSRLQHANERLGLHADLSVILKTLQLIAQADAQATGTVKIVLSRGEGPRGYSWPQQGADVWVFYYPQAHVDFKYDVIQSGVLEQAIGLSMPNLVGLKTLNRLEQVMLKHEADQNAWSEALVVDVQGTIVEGVSSNCFIRINDSWITPELRYNGVHGVMRAAILTRMQQLGITCEQSAIDMDDISNIQSLFFCNALHPMKIVSHLNTKPLDVQACTELFHSLQLNQIHKYVIR